MAEEENWTVVNSKSKTKKVIEEASSSLEAFTSTAASASPSANAPKNRPFQAQGEHKHRSKQSYNVNRWRRDGPSRDPGQRGWPQRAKFDKPTLPAARARRGTGETSGASGGPPPQPVRLLKRGTDPAPVGTSSSSPQDNRSDINRNPGGSLLAYPTAVKKHPPVATQERSQNEDNPGSSSNLVNKSTLPKQHQALQECATSSDATAAATTPKKRKARPGNKETRRKKREEKFYQALYENKDSHIQFVSADVIRQLQSDKEKASSFRVTTKNRNRTVTVPSLASTSSPSQAAVAETEAFQSFGDFPSLTPNSTNDSGEVSQSYCLAVTTVKPEVRVEKDTSCLSPREEPGCSPASAKPTPTPSSTSKAKKSRQPFVIDVSELIVKKREKDVDKKGTPLSSSAKTDSLRKNHKLTAGNPLDSSGPGVIHRGKIRDKKKKPTKLKLTILKSRALRKMLMETQVKQEDENENSASETLTDDRSFSKVDANEVTTSQVYFEESVSEEELKTPISVSDTNTTVGIKIEMDAECAPDVIFNFECVKVKTEFGEIAPDRSQEEHEEKGLPTPCESGEKEGILNLATSPTTADFQTKFCKLLDEMAVLKIENTIPPEVEIAVKSSMHNRKFRDYCDMYTSKKLHRLIVSLLSDLFRFQDRLYHTDPIKFKTKRRFISGLKEALAYLNLNKVQLLIIAPDIEKNPEPGGLDERMKQILTVAGGNNVPYVFTGSKYILGKPTRVKTPISIIAVLDKQNCEETFRAILAEASQLREKYQNDFISKVKDMMSSHA